MVLHRNRWVQLLAGLALGLQLLIASGLAMSAPSAQCGAAQAQPMGGDCEACATHDRGAGSHANGSCQVACAVASVALPLQCHASTMPTLRHAAPRSVPTLHAQSYRDDLLRPPATAAITAA